MALAFLLFALSQAASAAPSLRGSEAEQPKAPAPAVVVDGPETVFDPANRSVTVENLISCRYGVRCHGVELSANNVKSCNGTLVCRTEGGLADPQAQADASFVQMQDLANTSVAVANLLVCRYGSYCRGGWSWYGGRRECRGGVVCRGGPYYLDILDTDSNAGEQEAGAVSAEAAGPGGEQQAAGGGLLSNVTTMQTEDETDLISCRYGSYCRGGWWWYGGRKVCHGGVVCRPGPYYRHGGRVYEAASVEHPREHPREHPETAEQATEEAMQEANQAAIQAGREAIDQMEAAVNPP